MGRIAAFGPDGPNPPDAHALAGAVAGAALDAALPARLRARLAAGRPVAVVISVCDSTWIAEIDNAVRRLAPRVWVVARDGSVRSQHKPAVGGNEVAYALAAGRAVVGVASSPATVLPAALVSSADATVQLVPPAGKPLRRLLRRFARGPVPRDLGPAPCASLSFDEIVSAFRAGATARQVLANFRRTVDRKAAGARGDDDVPALPDLPGFSGEARDFGNALIDGFSRWRDGKCAWTDVHASAILAGPPGAGKTFFVRSLAKALRAPLHVTSTGEWFASSDGALGGVVQRFQAVWDAAMVDARAGGACLLIDEFDAIPSRNQLTDRAREWWTSLISQILTVTDGAVTDRTGLVLLGCTNAGSDAAPTSGIDAALLRKGRFDRLIYCPLPSASDLAAYVSYGLRGALSAQCLLPAVRLASQASAADAAAWARDARNLAAAAGRDVTVADVVAVVAPPDTRSDADRRRAAVHEAGHAVAVVHLGGRVDSASTVQSGGSGGRTVSDALPDYPTAVAIDRAAIVGLSGRAAEQVLLGAPSVGAERDLADVSALLAGAHASAGMGATLVHLAPHDEAASLLQRDPALRCAVETHVRRAYGEALALIEARRDAVERVAEALQRRRFLAGDEVGRLVRAVPVTGGNP